MLLSSCGTMSIPDVEVCADMKTAGAYCYTTLSNRERSVDPNDWEDERFGKLVISAKDWGEVKKAMQKGCKIAKWRCLKDVKKSIKTIEKRSKTVKRSLKRNDKHK